MKKERINPNEENAKNMIRLVNKKVTWIERYWNKNRLISIVSYGMRIRFKKAEMLYKDSLYTTNYKNMTQMAEMMIRAYDVLVKDLDFQTFEIKSFELLKSFEFRNKIIMLSIIEKEVGNQFNQTIKQQQKIDSIITAFLSKRK